MGLFSRGEKNPSGPPDEKGFPPPPPAYPAGPSHVPLPPAQPSSGGGALFACVLLSRSDRVRLISFPASVVQPVGEAIQRVWASGIQRQGPYEGGGYEWKLSGNPWHGYGHEAVPARRLLVHILHALALVGWHLVVSADLSKKGYDKDTLIFRPGPPMQRFFFSVSFNESDKIRIIDAPSEQLVDAFKHAVASNWALGVQDSKLKEHGCYQLKLRGTPWWSSDGVQVNQARMLACAVLSTLDSFGFELIASVDMSIGSSEGQNDLDSWFFGSKIAGHSW